MIQGPGSKYVLTGIYDTVAPIVTAACCGTCFNRYQYPADKRGPSGTNREPVSVSRMNGTIGSISSHFLRPPSRSAPCRLQTSHRPGSQYHAKHIISVPWCPRAGGGSAVPHSPGRVISVAATRREVDRTSQRARNYDVRTCQERAPVLNDTRRRKDGGVGRLTYHTECFRTDLVASCPYEV